MMSTSVIKLHDKKRSHTEAKKSHKLIEKERRQRINDRIEELRVIVDDGNQGVCKKSQILQVAIDRIDTLRHACNRLINQHKTLQAENAVLSNTFERACKKMKKEESKTESKIESKEVCSPTIISPPPPLIDIKSEVQEEVDTEKTEQLCSSQGLDDASWLQNISSFPRSHFISSQDMDYLSSSIKSEKDFSDSQPIVLTDSSRKRKFSESFSSGSEKSKQAEESKPSEDDLLEQQMLLQDQFKKKIEEQQAKNQIQLSTQIALIRQFQNQKGLQNQPTLQIYLNHLESKKIEEKEAFALFQTQMNLPLYSEEPEFQPFDFLA